MADADTTTTTPETKPDGQDDATFLRAEAKKAFKARDDAKAELRKLQEAGLVLTEDQRAKYADLEAAAAKAEEDRQKKAGEFDTLRTTLVKKHEADLEAERQARTKAEDDIRNLIVENAFAQASDLFGSSSAKTIYSARAGQKVFEEFVKVEIVDGRRRLVVLDLDGHPIVDAKTGKPASFAQAMSELIEALPDKDQHLRGSGKTGSGSSGGVAGGGRDVSIDFSNLTPDQRKDPKVLELLRQRRPRGGMVFGEAYSK